MSTKTIGKSNSSYREGLSMIFNPSSLLTGATVFLGALAMLPTCNTISAQATPDPIVIIEPEIKPL